MITDEGAVVHTSELRNLRKLILYGNPLAHAAVTSYDPTKLAYDPVPSLTATLNERTADQISMTIMVAYPATKKKKLHSMSCYEHVEIYKMIPNEVVLQSPFRSQLKYNPNDSTFLTGVGIEDVLTGAGSSAGLPAVPASMITRSLAADSRVLVALILQTQQMMLNLTPLMDYNVSGYPIDEYANGSQCTPLSA
ncbi:unnamed protein product [Phytophthora fragariaefolia]|uniref:Unnamed protein product n=1 Tax=Phytophthora fragariaefolia TaxID=1490495 RepID=A0A9W6YPH8_9STRA|nr:unnamed protein product [Phytophthora fragariaefolia]